MRLSTIRLEGFKSFYEAQWFSFDTDNGLYFVTGENKADSEMGANGAGKSALFEAICWCLYGKTSTNLKAGNIVSWGSKRTWVELEFDNGTIVRRTQNPNLLTINKTIIDQEELEKYFGYLGFESFLYSTFISQFSSKFFDLSPADKMFVFSDIMSESLKPWEDRSLQAKTKATQVSEQMNGMLIELSKLRGKVEQLEDTDYSKQIKDFEEEKKLSLEKADIRLKELVEQESNFRANLKMFMRDRAKFQIEHKQFKSVISRKEYEELKDKREKARDMNSAYKAVYQALVNDLEKMQGTVKNQSGICPVCKQMVSIKHLKNEIDSCKKQMARAELNSNDSEFGLRKLNEKILNFDKAIENEKKEISTREYELYSLDGKVKNLTEKIDSIRVDIQRQEVNIRNIKAMKNNYVQMEKERKANIKSFESAIRDNKDLYEVARKEFDAYTYWVKGFKEIRLLLMVEALKEFEVSINNNLSKFGMGDWNVKLDIDQENKSGTIRKGFAVLVESPNHNGFVPFEVWSGGEGQRLRLAGTIGLMDLIQSKRQTDFGLEIFDEPTAWLSDKGIEDLLQILYYRAKEKEIKIFLIDHKQLSTFGGFHGIINIIKDEKGSHIQ
jgi:DNA repair exonuclease SbcCD ATPase subunit